MQATCKLDLTRREQMVYVNVKTHIDNVLFKGTVPVPYVRSDKPDYLQLANHVKCAVISELAVALPSLDEVTFIWEERVKLKPSIKERFSRVD